MIEIHNEDCLDKLKEIPDSSIDLIVTDPPYKVDTKGAGVYGSVAQFKQIECMADGIKDEVLDELCRVMKKINIYLFCSKNQLLPLINYFIDKKCNWNLLSWHKTNPIPTCNNKYLPDTEYILFFREKGVKIQGTYDTKKHILSHLLTLKIKSYISILHVSLLIF